jgi:hypothetical protein
MIMHTPEELAQHLTNATGDSWTVKSLPKPIYGQDMAAYANNAVVEMYAVVVEVPMFGKSLHVVATQDGEQHTCTIQLRGHGIHTTILRAAESLRRTFESGLNS